MKNLPAKRVSKRVNYLKNLKEGPICFLRNTYKKMLLIKQLVCFLAFLCIVTSSLSAETRHIHLIKVFDNENHENQEVI